MVVWSFLITFTFLDYQICSSKAFLIHENSRCIKGLVRNVLHFVLWPIMMDLVPHSHQNMLYQMFWNFTCDIEFCDFEWLDFERLRSFEGALELRDFVSRGAVRLLNVLPERLLTADGAPEEYVKRLFYDFHRKNLRINYLYFISHIPYSHFC